MIGRLVQYLIGLAVCVGAYFGYSVAIVPLIEPQIKFSNREEPSREQEDIARQMPERQRQALSSWFPPGSWELTSSKVIENPRGGRLLFQEYEHRGQGQLWIRPCSVVFTTARKPGQSEEDWRRQAIILQAPEANLKFEEPFDLERGQVGPIEGGRLIGPILIRSDQKLPGPSDDLEIRTRDLVWRGDEVSSIHPLTFRLGANQGRGNELSIRLTPAPPQTGASSGPKVSGLRSFEVRHDVRMSLVMGGRGLLPSPKDNIVAGPQPPANAAPAAPGDPVDISCAGPFRFELEPYVATFHEAVHVVRHVGDGPIDELRGELLALHLVPSSGSQPSGKKLPRLEPDWLEARGNPVTVQSPNAGVHARGQILKYNLKTRAVSLTDEREAVVIRAQDEIRARELFFEPAAEGPWSVFRALGPGWLRGTAPAKSRGGAPGSPTSAIGPSPAGAASSEGQPFEAVWSVAMRLRPHQGQEVLSVEGHARVQAAGLGGLSAEMIHLWLKAVPGPGPAPPGQPAPVKLVPDRLLAENEVQFDSGPLTGAVTVLKAWIIDAPRAAPGELPPPSSAVPGAADTLPPPNAQANTLPEPAPAANRLTGPSRKFHIESRSLQVELLRSETGMELARAAAQDDVQLRESQVALPDEDPFRVDGQDLEVVQSAPGQAVVRVHGELAHVHARGMSLDGRFIRLDQATNIMEVEGEGRLEIANASTAAVGGMAQAAPGGGVAPAAAGGGAPRQPLEVRWRGNLTFDGQLARFRRDVIARMEPQTLATQLMEVRFTERVNFAGAGPATQPQVETVFCREGVLLDRLVSDAQGKLSDERIQVQQLELNQLTGEIDAPGAGWLQSVRREQPGKGMLPPGLASAAAAAAAPVAAKAGLGLTFLGVRFQQGLIGNLHHRQLTFRNDVQAVYGPVRTWESTLQPDADPTQLGPRGMCLSCDELHVAQRAPVGQQAASFELTARGSAIVEGSTFTARSDQVRYDQVKQNLVLEGDGRANAVLERQEIVGGPLSTISARKFSYSLTTGNWIIIDGSSADLGLMPSRSPR